MSKAEAKFDVWLKDIAPSTELRKWFGHDQQRWAEFCRRYRVELAGHRQMLTELRQLAREGTLTLIYAAKDEAHNEAVVLRKALLGRPERWRKKP